MPKVNIKKGRTKSYEEKLRDRRDRMNIIDRPEDEAMFMPYDELSDNDNDAPLEIATKREILPLVNKEPELPEIKMQTKKREKKKTEIKRVAENEFAIKVDNVVKLKIKAPKKNKWAERNKMSFREQLLMTSTNKRRSKSSIGVDSGHIAKWSKRLP